MSIATDSPATETRIRFTGVGFDVYEALIPSNSSANRGANGL